MNTTIAKFIHTNARNWAFVAPRIALGVIMAAHGAQKLFGWFGGYGLQGTAGYFAQQLGMTPGVFWAALTGSGEFFGGVLLTLGFATRFAALTTTIIMAVAVMALRSGGFFAPAGIEFPLALLAASLAFLIGGGGALSIDARLSRANT
jgi:putative oxidoreductase